MSKQLKKPPICEAARVVIRTVLPRNEEGIIMIELHLTSSTEPNPS
jgi:hypothetical protein